jgi:hypothetical protein
VTDYRVTSTGDRRVTSTGAPRVWRYSADFTETMSLTDVLTGGAVYADAFTEVLALADTLVGQPARGGSFTETLTIREYFSTPGSLGDQPNAPVFTLPGAYWSGVSLRGRAIRPF